jgi:hypothetical protein
MLYSYFPEPRHFVGRPLLALLFAVGMGCLLSWLLPYLGF